MGLYSDRTEGVVTAIYDCHQCMRNYRDQCSYAPSDESLEHDQRCLLCESTMNRVE